MRGMGRRSGKQIVLMAVVAATLVGGVLAGVLLGPRLAGKRGQAAADGDKATEQTKGHGGKSEGSEEGANPQIVILGEFTVNVRAAGALRYLQAEVAIALSGLPEPKKGGGGHGGGAPAAPALPEADAALAKDRVVAVLSAADFQQTGTPEGREALKRQIGAALEKGLPAYQVHEVLFTSFVMQ